MDKQRFHDSDERILQREPRDISIHGKELNKEYDHNIIGYTLGGVVF